METSPEGNWEEPPPAPLAGTPPRTRVGPGGWGEPLAKPGILWRALREPPPWPPPCWALCPARRCELLGNLPPCLRAVYILAWTKCTKNKRNGHVCPDQNVHRFVLMSNRELTNLLDSKTLRKEVFPM